MRSRASSSLGFGLGFLSCLVSLLHLPLLSVLLTGPHQLANAESCIAMDANFNLFVFGVNGKDYNVGTQDQWTNSNSAKDITSTGRPPFNGANTTCYLAQFFNAIYVLNGDASKPSTVFIYNAGSGTWSTQNVTDPKKNSDTSSLDLTDFVAILDHDTNVFYSFSKGQMYMLDMGSLASANSTPLAWAGVGAPSNWVTANNVNTQAVNAYEPVMALAQNHIHFINFPGLNSGQADIFVIHFSYFQPEKQSYPASSGSSFPASHGSTASLFQANGVQQEFTFIPDSGSATYVINVENNNTQVLAGPSVKDPSARYFAGVTSLVQLSSASSTSKGKGSLMFLPYTQGSDNSGAKWTSISALGNVNIVDSPAGTLEAASGTSTGSVPVKTTTTGSNSSNSGVRMITALGGTTMAVVGTLLAVTLNSIALL